MEDEGRRTQAANWHGSIPVVLTLSSRSLSSPTMPPPIHVLVPRNTYLHVGLQTAVNRLHRFAPTTLSFVSGMIQKEPDPGASTFAEDDENDQADTNTASQTPSDSAIGRAADERYPVCWFEDEDTQFALRWHLFAGVLYDTKRAKVPSASSLPWKIRLHFTAYPTSQILPLEADRVLVQIQNFYKNSVKQALCLQYGNSKAAMNLTKESHFRLWDAVLTTTYPLHRQVNDDLPTQTQETISQIPVRVLVNAARPPIQRACRDSSVQLGALLSQWLPDYFETVNDTAQAKDQVVQWRVGGIQPRLELPVFQLWKALCHPDYFLYVIVLTN